MTSNDEQTPKNVPGELRANPKAVQLQIKPYNATVVGIGIVGDQKLVVHAFGEKARAKLAADQQKTAAEKRAQAKNRKPKDFDECYRDAQHVAGGKGGGWHGIPCGAFRAGMVRACKVVGVPMVDAKMALLIKADGYDRADGTPLVRITKGEPHMDVRPARNDDGSIDVRARPMFDEGWEATVTIEFDADLISVESVVNLLERMGRQVGVGEGRSFSPNSCGMGWGAFRIDPQSVKLIAQRRAA